MKLFAAEVLEVRKVLQRIHARAQDRIGGVNVLQLDLRVCRDGECPKPIVVVGETGRVAKLLQELRRVFAKFLKFLVLGVRSGHDLPLQIAHGRSQRHLGLIQPGLRCLF